MPFAVTEEHAHAYENFEFERGTYGDGEALGSAAACAAAAGVAAQSLGTKGLRQPVPQRGTHLHT